MAKSYLLDEHHCVRYVPWTRLRKDENDHVLGVLAVAFQLRENEDFLSATWAEFFKQATLDKDVSEAVRAIRASNMTVSPRSGFAIGNVAQIKSACVSGARKHKVRILHESEHDNPAHAALRGWPIDNDDLLNLIADDVWCDFVLNKDVP